MEAKTPTLSSPLWAQTASGQGCGPSRASPHFGGPLPSIPAQRNLASRSRASQRCPPFYARKHHVEGSSRQLACPISSLPPAERQSAAGSWIAAVAQHVHRAHLALGSALQSSPGISSTIHAKKTKLSHLLLLPAHPYPWSSGSWWAFVDASAMHH